MEINRNQYFMTGLVILMLGIQLRYVQAYALNEKSSQFIAKRLDSLQLAPAEPVPSFVSEPSIPPPISRRTVRPPKWLGFALLSVGAVFTLHSLAMKRPN